MRYSSSALERLHRLSIRHRDLVQAAPQCACFHCGEFFSPEQIMDWVDGGVTALCPKCGIDSVVPETQRDHLEPDLIASMRAYWFERSIMIPDHPSLLQRLRIRLEPFVRRWTWDRSSGKRAV